MLEKYLCKTRFEVCYRKANAAIALVTLLTLSLALHYFEYIFRMSKLLSLLTPGETPSYREGKMPALSSACKTDQADTSDWLYFPTSNLMEEISCNTKALSANT